MFPFKLGVFAKEALAVIGTPLALFVKLAPRARSIVEYYVRTKRRCPVVGDVCSYAKFEGDEHFETNQKVHLSVVNFQREFEVGPTGRQRTVLSRCAGAGITISSAQESVFL